MWYSEMNFKNGCRSIWLLGQWLLSVYITGYIYQPFRVHAPSDVLLFLWNLNQVTDNGIITREVPISENVFVHSAIPYQSYCPGLELIRDTCYCEKQDINPLAGCTWPFRKLSWSCLRRWCTPNNTSLIPGFPCCAIAFFTILFCDKR